MLTRLYAWHYVTSFYCQWGKRVSNKFYLNKTYMKLNDVEEVKQDGYCYFEGNARTVLYNKMLYEPYVEVAGLLVRFSFFPSRCFVYFQKWDINYMVPIVPINSRINYVFWFRQPNTQILKIRYYNWMLINFFFFLRLRIIALQLKLSP